MKIKDALKRPMILTTPHRMPRGNNENPHPTTSPRRARLATGFVVPTSAQDPVDPKTAQQIRALTAKFNEEFNKHDPAAVAALYTEDAVWVTYHGTFHGRQRIEKVFEEWCFQMWNKHNWVTTISRMIPVGNEV